MLFLHLSDIHFKKVEVGQPDDPNLALRSDIIRDVRRMRKEIGRPRMGSFSPATLRSPVAPKSMNSPTSGSRKGCVPKPVASFATSLSFLAITTSIGTQRRTRPRTWRAKLSGIGRTTR